MKSHALALTVGLALALPATAFAEEVFADLGGARVPVGPEDAQVVRVERAVVNGVRYAVVRSRDALAPSRCAVPAERVSAWTEVDGRWAEALNEVFDRCPADGRAGIALTVRARIVQWTDGPAPATELHVRLLDPRLSASTAPITRFRRVGDRFVTGRAEAPFAAPTGAPSSALAAVSGRLDTADAWRAVQPFAQLRGTGAQRADVWLGVRGSVLRFAARVEGADAARGPELTLRLAEPGVSTARLRSRAGNAGRTLTVRCESEGPRRVTDATVRCVRDGDAVRIEGETDLASMLWSRNDVSAVAALATVTFAEGRAVASDAALRLRTVALPTPFDVMEGASAEALASCATGFRGRVSEAAGIGAMEGMITCGARCEDGLCERTVGTHGAATRVVWEPAARAGDPLCMNVTGIGADAFNACRGPDGDFTRLVGRLPARGFDLVIAVERTVRAAGAAHRRPEVWALVTRSARWQRLWSGEESAAGGARIVSVSLEGEHPTLCRDGEEGQRCERIDALSFTPAEDPSATAARSYATPRWN